MATPSISPLPLTGDILIDSMTTGFYWNTGSPIGYSFSGGFDGEYWIHSQYIGNQIQYIFDIFDDYIDVNFSYKGYFSNPNSAWLSSSDINISPDSEFISSELGDYVLAIGLFPNRSFSLDALGYQYYSGAEGDIFLNVNSAAQDYGYEPGNAGFSLLLHEIGHALGLIALVISLTTHR